MTKINLQNNKRFTRQNSLVRNSGGFTLLETLIAIFVMTVAFTALLSLMSTSLFSARYAKNEITAVYLAQEAVDYVRNNRDTLAFQGGDWNNFLASFGYVPGTGNLCFDSNGCYFEVDDSNLSNIKLCPSGDGCPRMLYDRNMINNLYGYTTSSSTADSNFTRTVTMQAVGTDPGNTNNDELMITVEMAWRNGSVDRSFILRSSLFKWQ